MSDDQLQGAEALIMDDGDLIIKDRVPKEYRHPELDTRLRTERTAEEGRLLQKAARAGVNVPDLISRKETALVLEKLDGDVLKDVFEDDLSVCEQIGEAIARLHARDIIHGDLTTSNMIRTADGELYLIDFGLGRFSQREEDRATDLHLLKEVLVSTHTAVADEAMARILHAYSDHAENAEHVLLRYQKIDERGRYK